MSGWPDDPEGTSAPPRTKENKEADEFSKKSPRQESGSSSRQGFRLSRRKAAVSDDPDGAETKSETEQQMREDEAARKLSGEKPPENKNPEGVPKK